MSEPDNDKPDKTLREGDPGSASDRPKPASPEVIPGGVFQDATLGYDEEPPGAPVDEDRATEPMSALEKNHAAREPHQDTPSGGGSPAKKSSERPSGAPAPDSSGPGGDGIQLRYFGTTNVGLIREHNEDNFLLADIGRGARDLDDVEEGAEALTSVTKQGNLLAVCDGMGGAAAGEVASQMAVDTLHDYFTGLEETEDRDHFAQHIVTAIEEAGARIFGSAKADRSRRGMGTTATVAGLMDKVLFVGQVGDSRAYILRRGTLVQITKDQSLVNQLIEAGQLTEDEAEAFEHSNIILQALGTTEDVTVDLTFLELRQGDRLLMCSDGLSGLVHQDMIQDVLESHDDLRAICERLIDMANTGGGHDNITVVCAEFGGDALSPAKAEDTVFYQQYPLPVAAEDASPAKGRKLSSAPAGKPSSSHRPRAAAAGPARHGSKTAGMLVSFALVAAVVLFFGLIAFWALSGRRGAQKSPVPTSGQGAQAEEPVDSLTTEILSGPATVRVTVTGVEGDLWVDNTRYQLPPDIRAMAVEVEPGVHTFESRDADGNALAQEVRQVNLGEPTLVSLVPVVTDLPLVPVRDDDDAPVLDLAGPDESRVTESLQPEERPESRRPPNPRNPTGMPTMVEEGPSMAPSGAAPGEDVAPTTMGVRGGAGQLQAPTRTSMRRVEPDAPSEEVPDNPFE